MKSLKGKEKSDKKSDDIIFKILVMTLFTIFTLVCVFPFYYIFINTISDNKLASAGDILFVPKGIHFRNYLEVFKLRGIGQAAFISVTRTVIGTLLTLIGSSFLGYVFCKPEFWKRKFWYRFVVIAMYFNAGLIPWFVTMKAIGLYDNYLAYILPTVVVPFYVILFKTFIEQIPASLEESVQIDGGGYGVRYFRIILPLSTPILATIAVFSSAGQWNSFLDTLYLIQSQELFTLQYVMYQYLNEVNALAMAMRSSQSMNLSLAANRLLTPTSVRMTISFVVVLPILFVYPFLQRYFVKGIMIGAIKG
ncbi:MAG TPA: ABC transporter permease [Clostridiales bacterium]|nr:carbohydrate ABC transporter permease [Clostridia bacterium]HCS73109.1 ABC transporter permease [Clostridiales bacterium]